MRDTHAKHSSLVIVAHFDVVGIAVDKAETNAPLIVHGNRMLALPIAAQRMQAIAGGHFQVVEGRRQVHVLQLARRATSGGKRLAAPVANRSCVRLSANDLITRQV